MTKIFYLAWREFATVVATKGFVIGVLLTPLLIAGMAVLMPVLLKRDAPKIDGELAMIDPTGRVVDGVREYLAPTALALRRADIWEKASDRMPEEVRTMAEMSGASAATEVVLGEVLGQVPSIRVVSIAVDADVEAEKVALRQRDGGDGGRLALVVVDEDAVERTDGAQSFGSYDLFVREKLDDRLQDEIRNGLRDAIVDARVGAAGFEREAIEALTHVKRRRSVTVTDEGEQRTNRLLNFLLPLGFMILLFLSVFSSGQALMTTTIEEKSSRVIEVLLSAVSPMQLMTGKIIGHMAVGFVMLTLYAGMGIAALMSFALVGMIDLSLLLYLLLFFVIAYFVVASMMAAVGAAVSEMREAQTLMPPIMITMLIPWLLWMPISRDPNSTLSTVTSFIPPINTFVMLLRLTSNTPPPSWQVWLSIAIGALSVYGALWFAAKVFRVGVLMFGKPPDLKTLVQWVRAA